MVSAAAMFLGFVFLFLTAGVFFLSLRRGGDVRAVGYQCVLCSELPGVGTLRGMECIGGRRAAVAPTSIVAEKLRGGEYQKYNADDG